MARKLAVLLSILTIFFSITPALVLAETAETESGELITAPHAVFPTRFP
ncbi:hypothetical protein GKG42_06870 [Lactonifactor sp. BIOML-A2]|nr:hypothetical protein [Lactonifactor sp. BIOML-A2]